MSSPPERRLPLVRAPWNFSDSRLENPRAPMETVAAAAKKFTVEALETLAFHMRDHRNPEISIAAAA